MPEIKVEVLEDTIDERGWYQTSMTNRKALFPKGHSDIGILRDEYKGKYAIINVKTMVATKPFLDEVFYSTVPLETWTGNYVIGRIGKFYYIVNKYGDCFHENELMYLICRNGIVALNPERKMMKFHSDIVYYNLAFIGAVDSEFEYGQGFSSETFVMETNHYFFAFVGNQSNCYVWLFDVYNSDLRCDWLEKKRVPLLTKYSSLLVNNWILQFKKYEEVIFFDKQFRRCNGLSHYFVKKVLSYRTKTYNVESSYETRIFSAKYGFVKKWLKIDGNEYFYNPEYYCRKSTVPLREVLLIVKADGSEEVKEI